MTVAAEIGVFGGSGFYSFLENVSSEVIDTPYGPPSAPVAIGVVAGRQVAFLPRHGQDHQTPAHKVNFRANLWAMRELGVRRILGPCAAGSLQPDIAPGDVVVLDQLVDRTSGRTDTYFDGPVPGHVSLADPYCPELRAVIIGAADQTGLTVHENGTVVVISGPRFSTRAESAWYRSAGWHAINMTQYPEAALARELGICYVGIAMITDYDVGVEGINDIAPVEMHEVFAVLKANVEKTRELLSNALPMIPKVAECRCITALDSGPLRPS